MPSSFYRPRAIEQTFTDHASHQVAILERPPSDRQVDLGAPPRGHRHLRLLPDLGRSHGARKRRG